MPELPEVETVKRGLTPLVTNKAIATVALRQTHLRWPIPNNLGQLLKNQSITSIERRSKYLLFAFNHGTLIIHLGMSGTLRFHAKPPHPEKHDHVDICFHDQSCLRYNDPRRFGAILWTDSDVAQHKLLKNLGPEPLSNHFTYEYFFEKTRKRQCNIKQLIMNSQIVVGVGNIYANEALFEAGIKPTKSAGKLTKQQTKSLLSAIQLTLRQAIKQGGTTLKDFKNSEGKPGYFTMQLQVYGKGNKPCPKCCNPLKELKLNGRSTFFCHLCQH